MSKFIFLILFLLAGEFAFAIPNSLQVSGRILRPDGTAFESTSVPFQLALTDAAEACVLHEESATLNMIGSNGRFTLSFGNNTPLFDTNGSLSNSIRNGVALSCQGGGSYTPGPAESRKIVIRFNDGTSWNQINPSLSVNSVPYAMQAWNANSADRVGTLAESDILFRSLAPMCVTPNSFLQWNGTDFDCTPATTGTGTVTNVTSSNAYLTVATGSSTPVLTLNVGTAAGTVAAGDDSRFTNARTPTGAAGGDLTGSYPNPTLALSGVTAGTYPKVTVDDKGRVTTGEPLIPADIPNLDAAKITTGTLSRDVLATNVSATNGQFSNLRVYDGVSEFITMTYPSSGSASYALQWPAVQGGANTFLQNNGSGILTWTSAIGGSGTVTDVTSTNAYLSVVTGTTTPTLTANVGTSANTLAAGNDSRFTDARTPTGTATGDLSGTYPNPTVTSLQGRAVTSTSPVDGQAIVWDNGLTTWRPEFIRAQDLRNAWGGTQMIPASACLANQSMTWSVVTDRFACQSIGSLDTAAITSGVINPERLGSNTADSSKYLRGDGTWQVVNATDSSKLPLVGGTMSGEINMSGQKIINISNVPFVATNPALSQDGQTLRWNNSLSQWEWFTPGTGGAYITDLTGDVLGTGPGTASVTVEKIRGVSIDPTASVTGNFLKYNGASYLPGSEDDPTVESWAKVPPSSLFSTAGNLNLTKQVPTSVTLPTFTENGQSLRWNNSTSLWEWYLPTIIPGTAILDGGNTPALGLKIGTTNSQETDFIFNNNSIMTISAGVDILGNFINVAGKSQPPTPAAMNGRFYYNSSENRFKFYEHSSGIWKNLVTSSSPGSSVQFDILGGDFFRIQHPKTNFEVNDQVFIESLDATAEEPLKILKVSGQTANLTLDSFSSDSSLRFSNNGLESFSIAATTADLKFNSSAGTPLMSIKADGKLGIGTTSPSDLIHVSTNSAQVMRLDRATSIDGNSADLTLAAGHSQFILKSVFRPALDDTNFQISNSASSPLMAINRIGLVSFGNSTPGPSRITINETRTDQDLISISALRTTAPSTSSNSIFINSGAASFTLKASNNSGNTHLDINSQPPAANPNFTAIRVFGSSSTTEPRRVGINLATSDTGLPSTYKFYVNGDAGGTSVWNSLSDARYKKEIVRIPSALEKITKISGVSYRWDITKDPNILLPDRYELGVIAQEVEQVFPEAVNSPKDGGMKTVAYTMLIAPLIEAVKELYAMIGSQNEQLSQQNQVLQNQVDQQQLQINEMRQALCELGKAHFCQPVSK